MPQHGFFLCHPERTRRILAVSKEERLFVTAFLRMTKRKKAGKILRRFAPQNDIDGRRFGKNSKISVRYSHYFKKEKTITTAPRTTSTMPVARLRVFGSALFAKMAAILAQRKVKATHSARMSQSGEPPMEK